MRHLYNNASFLHVLINVFYHSVDDHCADTPGYCWSGRVNSQTCTTPPGLSHSLSYTMGQPPQVCDSCLPTAACSPLSADSDCSVHKVGRYEWWAITVGGNTPLECPATEHDELAFMDFGQTNGAYIAICTVAALATLAFLWHLRRTSLDNREHAVRSVDNKHVLRF